jgi:uncharacterized membrane protein
VFVAAAFISYRAYNAARFDLGNMVQAIWSTADGRLLETTTISGLQQSRLAGHVDPFLVLLVPFWSAWQSPLMLLVIQVLAVASGALPVFWLGRKYLGSGRAAANFAFAYLLYPATQWNAFEITSGIHAVSFAIPLILFAVWYLESDRLIPFAIVGLLAASTKEEVGVAVGFLGIWYAVRHHRWRVGLAILGIGGAISLVDFLVIIPHFAAADTTPFSDRYSEIGGTPGGILHHAFTDPVALFHVAASGHKLAYLGYLFIPFLGLCFLEPLLLLCAMPELAINMLSSKPGQTKITDHYAAAILPFVIASAILGAAKLRRFADGLSVATVLCVGAVALLFSPLKYSMFDLAKGNPSDPVHRAKTHALRLIPSDAPVSASNQLGAFLSARRYIYTYPFVAARASWVIVDVSDYTYRSKRAYRQAIERIDHSPRWHLVFSSNGIQVLRRAQPPAAASSSRSAAAPTWRQTSP